MRKGPCCPLLAALHHSPASIAWVGGTYARNVSYQAYAWTREEGEVYYLCGVPFHHSKIIVFLPLLHGQGMLVLSCSHVAFVAAPHWLCHQQVLIILPPALHISE